MNFVFITYPYHYHITLTTIKKVYDMYNPSSITIMFDDYDKRMNSKFNFVSSIEKDCRELGIENTVIPFSAVPNSNLFPDGWERQQIVKLYMHEVLSFDDWICVDGDTIIQEFLSFNKMYINVQDALCPFPHHYNLVDYILDLNHRQINFNGRLLNTVSGMPIKHMRKHIMYDLHAYIHQLHGCDLVGILKSFTLKENISRYFQLAEWDIMGHYEVLIAQDHMPFESLFFVPIQTKNFESTVCIERLKILAGHDNLSREWYHQNGVRVNEEVFNFLGY